jgi:primosomal protein N' (replication factor Y) (superfamily II helicase)
LPVARVVLDVPLAHLDRPFDYLVPASLDQDAQPGVRVRVRFSGRLVNGFVLGRAEESTHAGKLARLDRVVSAEPVLAPEILRLARDVADYYAGTLADVLRLAVPPRHAAVEAATPADSSPAFEAMPAAAGHDLDLWDRYRTGPAFLRALASGGAPAAVWTALPGPTWPAEIAAAVGTALDAGRGALVVVPDGRDAARVSAALSVSAGLHQHVVLTAELGPAERYRRWLAVRRGQVRAVVGTRAAAFAPVRDLGLAVVWDDGDDLHAEPRAPYPHVREVLARRAEIEGAALVVGGLARTAEAQSLLTSGRAHAVEAPRLVVRASAPAVRAAGDDAELARDPAARSARLPSLAWDAARTALLTGPVLVQVPRRGYLPALACTRCRTPARCAVCSGPLALAGVAGGPGRGGSSAAHCSWCGRPAVGWTCGECGGTEFRALAVGHRRTAEELGRAFAGVVVRTSGRDAEGVIDVVGPEPALVVATPGAEPVAEGGYAAALLLDGWELLGRPDLRAGEEAVRRWLAAAALVRSGADGGKVILVADSQARQVQAVLRWDPAGSAERELAERAELGFPPASRLAEMVGPPVAVHDLLDILQREGLPPGAAVLGPTQNGDEARALIRVPAAIGQAMAAAVKAAQSVRSARKSPDHVRVRIDPAEIG